MLDQLIERRRLYTGVACIAGGTLILELTLTRIFSVVMYYHFAFMAISLALFGLGLAGVYIYIRPQSDDHEEFFGLLRRYSLASAISTIFAVTVILNTKVELTVSASNLKSLGVVYLAGAVPFFFCGMALTTVINRMRTDMGRLYFYDLAGAGLGCMAITFLLGWFGGVSTALGSAILFVIAAVCFQKANLSGHESSKQWGPVALVGGLVVILTIANAYYPFIRIGSVKSVKEARLIYSKWNSFSRVTVEEAPGNQLWMKMDSSAATRIFSKTAEEKDWEPVMFFSKTRVAGLVYALEKPGGVLIIGPGGGTDVIAALKLGADHVTGVELNPIIANDVMKGEFLEYSGHLYDRPEVDVVVNEGRSFIRSNDNRYASIQATLVDTWAATAAGAFTLSENTLYTTDAFVDYIDHLTSDGSLTMTRWTNDPPREFLRLLVIGRAALEEKGIHENHAKHFFIASNDRLATFVLKPSGFSKAEAAKLDRYVKDSNLKLVHNPYAAADNAYANFLHMEDWRGFVAQQQLDLSAPSDNRPFFFYTVRPADFLSVLQDTDRLTRHNLGLSMLLVLIGVVFLLVVVFLVGPLFVFRPDVLRHDRGGKARYLGYFVGLGGGFITVEMAFMQKFILFLGHPTYALVVVLFALLIFSGIGSFMIRDHEGAAVAPIIKRNFAILAALLACYLVGLTPFFNALVGLPLSIRVPLAVLCIAPLGVIMGTFLPLGIQGAGERFGEIVPWAWGMNGAASVLGSAVAIALAMNIGFNLTLVVGLAYYAAGMVCALGILGRETASSSS